MVAWLSACWTACKSLKPTLICLTDPLAYHACLPWLTLFTKKLQYCDDDTRLIIENKWGEIDFELPIYHTGDYHKAQGTKDISATLQATQSLPITILNQVEDNIADKEYLMKLEVAGLARVGEELSKWNISHPILLVGNRDGFTRWRDTAVLAIESKHNGKMPKDVPDYWFELARAWYLKVWDLEMQVASPRRL